MRYFELLEDKTLLNRVPNISDIKKLGNIFKKEGYEIRLVGGVVRDLLQDKKPKDVDLATTATPNQMIEISEKYKIKSIPTGLQHGTITFMINGEPYEITTLRIDKKTDGRHAEIEFTTDWVQDAERRDLTFNAISMSLDGEVFDYFGGIDDLKNGKAKFVGSADKRISEDYLRILRYFRFQGRVNSPTWDKDTLKSIKDNVNGLSKISGERIWMEFSKILSGNHLSDLLVYMNKTNTLKMISIPSNNINNINRIKNQSNDAIILLAELLNNKNEAETINNRYKLSANERAKLFLLVENKNKNLDKKAALELIVNKKIDKSLVADLLLLQNNTELANIIRNIKFAPFPVSGQDLIQKGFNPGPEMGKLLQQLKSAWINSNFTASKEDLLIGI